MRKKETIWLLNQQFQEEEEEYLLLKILKKEKVVNFGREVHLNIKTFKKKYLDKIKIFPQIVSEIYKPPVYDLDVLSYKGELKKIILRKRIISEEPNSGHEFCAVPKNLTKKIKILCKKNLILMPYMMSI